MQESRNAGKQESRKERKIVNRKSNCEAFMNTNENE